MKKILHSNILKQKNSQPKMKPPNQMYCQNTAELNFCCILQHKQHDFKVSFLRDTIQLNKKKKKVFLQRREVQESYNWPPYPSGREKNLKNGNHLQLLIN